ncbi:hypothetical protein COO60DRAFT_1504837 [Scenedesmus sp. NREL 46B-D3]|nr:hypothetical protein COO60DRAFT_1504837 [Scenedesmus sp. NREL 46B-D3]
MQTVFKPSLNAASIQQSLGTRHHQQQYKHTQLPQLQHHQQRAALLAVHGLKENVAKLAPIDTIQLVTLQPVNHSIPNAPGKKASVAIYAHLAAKYGGKITADAANEGLELYGEYVEDAKQVPGSHPNIDILLAVLSSGKELTVDVQQQQQ